MLVPAAPSNQIHSHTLAGERPQPRLLPAGLIRRDRVARADSFGQRLIRRLQAARLVGDRLHHRARRDLDPEPCQRVGGLLPREPHRGRLPAREWRRLTLRGAAQLFDPAIQFLDPGLRQIALAAQASRSHPRAGHSRPTGQRTTLQAANTPSSTEPARNGTMPAAASATIARQVRPVHITPAQTLNQYPIRYVHRPAHDVGKPAGGQGLEPRSPGPKPGVSSRLDDPPLGFPERRI